MDDFTVEELNVPIWFNNWRVLVTTLVMGGGVLTGLSYDEVKV